MDFSMQQLLALAAAGLVAGVVNGTVGGGSLLTYAVFTMMGTPPVLAAATNTTGFSSGNAAALIPHRDGSTVDLGRWRWHALWTAVGALCGGLLLISLPDKVFEFVVPILLISASLMMLRKPREVHLEPARSARTRGLLWLSGIYNGYFGPGQGVIAVSILMRDGRLTVGQAVVIKNLVLAWSNVVVSALFIATGHVLWPAAVVLLGSVGVGGWWGGTVAHRINPSALRYGVAAVGFISAAWFLVRR
jgi:uncharacterized membrane protein YfcA